MITKSSVYMKRFNEWDLNKRETNTRKIRYTHIDIKCIASVQWKVVLTDRSGEVLINSH